MDVTLISCARLPEPDPDAEPLATALAAAGIESRVMAWDDPRADPAAGRMAVLRSCWNYPQHHREFLDWARGAASVTRLWNPLPVVRWNVFKGYLLDLAERGVPTVPTHLVRQGDDTRIPRILDERGWEEIVIKPAISAASFRTRRFERGRLEPAEQHLRQLLTDGDVLIQQYLPSVEGHGERALVVIDGELTHAVRKSPRFEGQDENVSADAVEISAAEAHLARQALDAVDAPLLYARVDVAPGPEGHPVIMELELVEPSLFFPQCPGALERFVAAIGRRLRSD